jgi:hypothetical protein
MSEISLDNINNLQDAFASATQDRVKFVRLDSAAKHAGYINVDIDLSGIAKRYVKTLMRSLAIGTSGTLEPKTDETFVIKDGRNDHFIASTNKGPNGQTILNLKFAIQDGQATKFQLSQDARSCLETALEKIPSLLASAAKRHGGRSDPTRGGFTRDDPSAAARGRF